MSEDKSYAGHTHSHSSEANPTYLLAFSLILVGALISASIYFSMSSLNETLSAKSFTVVVNAPVNNTINLTAPTGTAANAAANAANNAAANAANNGAQNGCGTGQQAPSAPSAPAPVQTGVVNVSGRAILGNASAKLTIVEFSDFQCPFCVRVQPTMHQVMNASGGQIDMIHINYIVHPTAKPAHVAVECAGDQNKYWAMHDLIFNTSTTDDTGLKTLAQSLGLDMAKFNNCTATGKDATLAAQQAAGSAAGVGGTPSFIIGVRKGDIVTGRLVVGALPYENYTDNAGKLQPGFKTIIAAEMAKAK